MGRGGDAPAFLDVKGHVSDRGNAWELAQSDRSLGAWVEATWLKRVSSRRIRSLMLLMLTQFYRSAGRTMIKMVIHLMYHYVFVFGMDLEVARIVTLCMQSDMYTNYLSIPLHAFDIHSHPAATYTEHIVLAVTHHVVFAYEL